MVSRWIGGGNNKASNPKDWSPEGVPTNDSAIISQGVMTIDGNELAGDTNALLVQGVTSQSVWDRQQSYGRSMSSQVAARLI